MIAKSKKTSLVIKVDVLAEHTFSGIVVIDDNFYTAGNYSEKWRLDCFDIEKETKQENKPLELYSSYELEKWKKEGKDPIVQKIVDKFQERSKVGIQKYGTTLEENELSLDEWLNHAVEEQMDNILYLTKLREELKKKGIK